MSAFRPAARRVLRTTQRLGRLLGDQMEHKVSVRPDQGLYVPPLIWHEVHHFAAGSVCAVQASGPYPGEDYFRSYQEFLEAVRQSR